MKILFDRNIKDAVLTAANQSDQYAVENLQSDFLYLRYQTAAARVYDSITGTFTTAISVNSFWYGHTNADFITFSLYDSGDNLLYHGSAVVVDGNPEIRILEDGSLVRVLEDDSTELILEPIIDPENGAVFFPQVDGVASFLIEISNADETSPIYLGGVDIGLAFEMPNPNASFLEDMLDNSVVIASPDGQITADYIRPLRVFGLNFSGVTTAGYKSIFDEFRDAGRGGIIWADVTELAHDVHKPLYCSSNGIESPSRDVPYCKFSLTLTEAR